MFWNLCNMLEYSNVKIEKIVISKEHWMILAAEVAEVGMYFKDDKTILIHGVPITYGV